MTPRDTLERRLLALARGLGAARRHHAAAPSMRRATFRRAEKRAVRVVSQLLHGEVATRESCARLAELHPLPAARRCLTLQAKDEARHVAAYTAYLEAVGDIEPPLPGVLEAVRGAIDWPGAPGVGLLLANLVLESEAVRLQNNDLGALGCPALAAINRDLAKDEARHVALGRALLRDAADGLEHGIKEDLRERTRGLWWTCAEAAVSLRAGPFTRGVLKMRWRRMERDLAAAGFGPP